jgi:acetoin utilization deacetylase AcuC-like enzyme
MNARSPNASTGWVFDSRFLRHNADIVHPERPTRLQAILDRLKQDNLLPRLTPVEFDSAPDEAIARVHSRQHIMTVESARSQYLDPDTFVSDESPEIAKLAAGGVLEAATRVWNGDLSSAFCAVRPPGHHATSERAMGFCLYNNVAIAAAALTDKNPDAKVLILDWDVHHGNGTQAIFYDRADVMYASLHQYPFYPGTGSTNETGRGEGEGFTVNVPVAAGADDEEFLAAISRILQDHAAPFAPHLVMISAGFDAHARDPLGGLNVSTGAFADATRRVCAFAGATCQGRVVSVLEGGYDLDALSEAVSVHVQELLDAAARAQEGAA